MIASGPDGRLDLWERRLGAVSAAVPYALLAASALLAGLQGGQSRARSLGTLGLVGLAAGWMLWMVTAHPAWARRRALMACYCAGLLALIAALIARSPWFGMFAFTGYLHSWAFLPGKWRLVGVAATAVLATGSWTGGFPPRSAPAIAASLVVVGLIVALVGLFSALGEITGEQNRQRKRALAELAEANRRLEVTLAENAGLHAQLLTQAREAGVLDERQRLAREIHDTLAQGFTGIIAQLEAAKQARRHPEQWRQHLDQAQTLARESLGEARRAVQALRPAPLEEARLPEALADLAGRWSRGAGVALHVATTGEPRPLPAEVEVALFGVAREALTNVSKHARASRVGVTLSYTDDMVLLDVRDDGVGFDPGSVNGDGRPGDGRGFGLDTMRQRLRQVAGALEIESAPGEGTSINARVPTPPRPPIAGRS